MAECCTSFLVVEKSVDKSNVIVGDIVTYSISVVNQGETPIYDLVVIDPLPTQLKFIADSVIVGGKALPGASVIAGVCIGTLAPNTMKTVSFQAQVIERPVGGVINNKAIVKFKCKKLADGSTSISDMNSNIVTIKVDSAEVKVIKETNAKIISRGDIVTYTVKLINTGTLEAKNIMFTDIIGSKNVFFEETFTVNGIQTSADVTEEDDGCKKIKAYTGSLLPNEEIVIAYKVQIMVTNCKEYVVNKAFVTFNYNHPAGTCGEKKSQLDEASISKVELGLCTFKQLSIDGYLKIPDQKPDIEEVNNVAATAELVSSHIITTPISTSREGQSLSGYKLIVRGVLDVVVEYTANLEVQSVHSAHYTLPFSTFIILSEDYCVGCKVDVEFIIEDIYYQKSDLRNLFENITLLINAKTHCC